MSSVQRFYASFSYASTDPDKRDRCQRPRTVSSAAQTSNAKVCWAVGVGPSRCRANSYENSPRGLLAVFVPVSLKYKIEIYTLESISSRRLLSLAELTTLVMTGKERLLEPHLIVPVLHKIL